MRLPPVSGLDPGARHGLTRRQRESYFNIVHEPFRLRDTCQVDSDPETFVSKRYIATLAYVDATGRAAAASLFYAYDGEASLFFASRRSSQHARSFGDQPEVALAIYADASDTDAYAGLQLRGIVHEATGAEGASLATRYEQRFGLADDRSVGVAPPEDRAVFSFQIDRYKFVNTRTGRADEEYRPWLME